MSGLIRLSPAKINWNLRVLHRRPDGYHEIESLVSAVALCDELTFELKPEPGCTIECNDPGVPLDASNLIARAAELLGGLDVQRPLGAHCRLVKQIPVGGGLGGGSSNAATALRALNELRDLGWPAGRLHEWAGQLGSDVPFFLVGGSAIIRGRGELITRVETCFAGWLVLLLPSFSTSTAAVYRAYRPGTAEDRGDVGPQAGLDARGWMERAFNMLEPAAQGVSPGLGPLMRRASELARRPVRISGSGSSLFTAFDTMAEAQAFAVEARERLEVQARVVTLFGVNNS